ncbi:MAG: TolC family protein, partial [Gemmatimonadota bacterium]
MITGYLLSAVLAGLAFLSPGDLASDTTDGGPLRLDEVVGSALATHPEIAGARAELGAAAAEAGQVRAARWPTVAVSGLGTRYQEPMVVAPLHGFDPMAPPAFDETLYQGHASAEYTLYDGGSRGARIRGASSRAEAAGSAVRAARQTVVADAIRAYLAALSAREVRAAHERQVDALDAERGRTSLMLEQGKAPRVAVLRAQAALGEARAVLEAADERLRLALRRLVRISGLPADRVTAEGLVPVGPGSEPLD